MIELNQTPTNEILFGYPTQNYDLGFAHLGVSEFKALEEEYEEHSVEWRKARQAVQYIDNALGILRVAQDRDHATVEEYVTFEEEIDAAEAILDELGVVEDHGYLRDTVEEVFLDLMDEDTADLDSEGWEMESGDLDGIDLDQAEDYYDE